MTVRILFTWAVCLTFAPPSAGSEGPLDAVVDASRHAKAFDDTRTQWHRLPPTYWTNPVRAVEQAANAMSGFAPPATLRSDDAHTDWVYSVRNGADDVGRFSRQVRRKCVSRLVPVSDEGVEFHLWMWRVAEARLLRPDATATPWTPLPNTRCTAEEPLARGAIGADSETVLNQTLADDPATLLATAVSAAPGAFHVTSSTERAIVATRRTRKEFGSPATAFWEREDTLTVEVGPSVRRTAWAVVATGRERFGAIDDDPTWRSVITPETGLALEYRQRIARLVQRTLIVQQQPPTRMMWDAGEAFTEPPPARW